jgi:hypothetical protein
MSLRMKSVRRLGSLAAGLSLAFLIAFVLNLLPGTVTGQTDCSGYGQCTALQGESDKKLTGNITYSFDEASLALLPSDTDRQAFRSAMIAAANDWAQRTGRSISQAPTGRPGT